MKVVDLVLFSRSILEMLSVFDIKTTDVRYLDLYSDFEKMSRNGDKVAYIAHVLSKRYGISVAKVYRILRKFRRAVKK